MAELNERMTLIQPHFDALDNCLHTLRQFKDNYVASQTHIDEEPGQDITAELDGTARLAIESVNQIMAIVIGPIREAREVRRDAGPWQRTRMLLASLRSALAFTSATASRRERVTRDDLLFHMRSNRKIIATLHAVERLKKEFEEVLQGARLHEAP